MWIPYPESAISYYITATASGESNCLFSIIGTLIFWKYETRRSDQSALISRPRLKKPGKAKNSLVDVKKSERSMTKAVTRYQFAMAFPTLAEQIGVEEVGLDEFISICLPFRIANSAPIAYGGCAMSVAVTAAVRTVKPAYHPYSVLGYFLGPARTDLKLKCRVRRLRDTRTFATRQVEVFQTLKTGESRLCLTLTADFQVKEASMYEYSVPPVLRYRHSSECPTQDENAESLVEQGYMTSKRANEFVNMFRPMRTFFESRFSPEGVAAQTLNGYAKSAPSTQDHLPLTSRTSGDWFRVREPLSKDDQLAGLAFWIDGGLSFVTLIHDHKYIEDVGACSTLDFAIRIFDNDLDINNWHLRERVTLSGSLGRTYSEARLWNSQGKLVASMTQQCIMRPKEVPKSEL